MSFLNLLPQISIPPMEAIGVDDPTVARRFADRLKSRLTEMQKELEDDEQLEVVTFLPSGAAVTVDAVEYQSPALLTLKGQEQASGKACAILVHQSSLQIVVSVEKIPIGQAPKVMVFEIE
ncbi:MAG: hypothetical protein EWM72_00940 [Nitrospira sp.]|nr:MAG: hypothetical protein EWM72_00940 [Nitrospira sp.]